MKVGTLINAHLKHMKELTDKLAALVATIEEKDQVASNIVGQLTTKLLYFYDSSRSLHGWHEARFCPTGSNA